MKQPDLQKLFDTQAAWQRLRAELSWPEKIRIAEVMRESVRQLRPSSMAGGPASGTLKYPKEAPRTRFPQ